MARQQRGHSAGNSHLSPDISRSRHVDSSTSNEDLFLNLANDEPSHVPGPELQRKPASAIRATSGKPNTPPTTSSYPRRTLSTQVNTSSSSNPPATDTSTGADRVSSRPSYYSTLSDQLRELSSDRASLSSNDQSSPKYDDPTLQPSIPPTSAAARGRTWETNQLDGRTQLSPNGINGHKRSQRSARRPSNLSFETPKPHEFSSPTHLLAVADRSPFLNSVPDATESVGSTTAASTVWDELEELRQRIRRLEYNGNRVKSGVATEEPLDRPHTATTMTTTSSASNPGKRVMSSPTRPEQTEPAPSYPLLRSAMQKAKANVYPEVYKSLEATVADALDIAATLPKPGSPSLIRESGEAAVADSSSVRRLRRKSDSLCRSLTELCIALCEDRSRQLLKNAPPPNAIDSPMNPPYRSNDNSPLSYLDERRARLDRARSAPYHPSSRASSTVAPSIVNDEPASSYSRQSLAAQNGRRRKSDADPDDSQYFSARTVSRASTYRSQDDNEDRDQTIRVPSRAMSEIQNSRHSAARDMHKFSRDYTRRHPMPDRPPLSLQRTHTSSNISTPNLPPLQTDVANTRPHLRLDEDDSQDFADLRSVSRQSGGSAISTTLAERLEARRQLQNQQQVASAGQLGTITSAAASASRTRAISASKRPSSSGRLTRYERVPTDDPSGL